MRNYQNAAKQKGGEVIVDKSGYTALKFNRESGTVYAVVRTGSAGYRLYLEILEEKEMTQEVTANLMWEKLQKDGFISFQINFDTNKAIIKPESMSLIKQISDLMKSQPALKVTIEGHTDNQALLLPIKSCRSIEQSLWLPLFRLMASNQIAWKLLGGDKKNQ